MPELRDPKTRRTDPYNSHKLHNHAAKAAKAANCASQRYLVYSPLDILDEAIQ
jgi:hypothetical protein